LKQIKQIPAENCVHKNLAQLFCKVFVVEDDHQKNAFMMSPQKPSLTQVNTKVGKLGAGS
jgi:hypothetical protein